MTVHEFPKSPRSWAAGFKKRICSRRRLVWGRRKMPVRPAAWSLLPALKPSELGLLQLLDVVAQLQRGSQLQAQVLHDHVALQQQEGIAIDLLVGQDQRTSGRWSE